MNEHPREESQFLTFLACLLLNVGLTLGSIFCPITAFHLPVNEVQLVAALVLACLLASFLYRYRRAGLLLLGLWVLAVVWVLLAAWENLEQGARYTYTQLTAIYQVAYDFLSLPVWEPRSTGSATLGGITLLFALWGGVLACANAWVIRRRQSVTPALLLDALPLALCLVVVDTPPDLWCLILFLTAVCLLLLTQSSRVRSPRGGGRLTFGLALPVTALLLALCLLISPATYTRTQTAEELLQAALDWAGDILPLELDNHGRLRLALSVAGDSTADVDLRMGPRLPSRRTIMEVLAEETGSLYLRGSAFGTYTGVSWDRLPEEAFAGCPEPEAGLLTQSYALEGSQTLSIRSRTYLLEIYTPYYLRQLPEVGVPRQDSGLRNSGRATTYSISYEDLSPNMLGSNETVQPVAMTRSSSISFSKVPSEYECFIQNAGIYTTLPEASRRALLDIAQEAGLTGLSQADLPQAVADFVRDSARYDLNTPRMPSGQQDFASWFLTQSDTGYCVHFAAATAAMLRALDVPARMVTGYLVDAQADTWVEVTGDHAHAWAEYYCLGVGWVPLEATPPDGVTSTLHGREPTASESQPGTKPADTEPSGHESAETTTPAQGPSPTSPGAAQAFQGLELPGWLLRVLALLSLALLRRPVALLLRRRAMGRESPNRQLLRRWRLALPLCRLLRQSPPEEMEALALKARFSQHTITRKELKELAHWQATLETALRKAPLWKRLYARWVLILI